MTHSKLKACEVAGISHVISPVIEIDLITMAKRFTRSKLAKVRKINQPSQAIEHLQLLLDYEYEVFIVFFLESQHRVIRLEELFRGTNDAASVYPREVRKAALSYNTAAVILVHKPLSSDHEPSDTDLRITERLKKALGLMDIRVMDHLVMESG